jgi:hypothetical protein
MSERGNFTFFTAWAPASFYFRFTLILFLAVLLDHTKIVMLPVASASRFSS